MTWLQKKRVLMQSALMAARDAQTLLHFKLCLLGMKDVFLA